MRDKSERIGAQGDASEILSHPFFSDLDLPALERMEIQPPFEMAEKAADYSRNMAVDDLSMSVVPEEGVRLVSNS